MDSVTSWDMARVFEWAQRWLAEYRECREKGEHKKMCRCKTGPPLGLLVWIVETPIEK